MIKTETPKIQFLLRRVVVFNWEHKQLCGSGFALKEASWIWIPKGADAGTGSGSTLQRTVCGPTSLNMNRIKNLLVSAPDPGPEFILIAPNVFLGSASEFLPPIRI